MPVTKFRQRIILTYEKYPVSHNPFGHPSIYFFNFLDFFIQSHGKTGRIKYINSRNSIFTLLYIGLDYTL